MKKYYYDNRNRETLRHGTSQFPIAIYKGDLHTEEVPLHWHDEFEAGIVTDGEILLTVGSETHTIQAGEAYFINAGTLHSFTYGDNDLACQKSFVFSPSIVGGRVDSIFWLKYCQPLIAHPENELVIFNQASAWQSDAIHTIRRIWNLCSGHCEEYELDVRHQLSHLLFLLCGHLSLDNGMVSEKSRRDGARIKTMICYIHDHYAEDLSIMDVASSTMISHSEALRCFHDTIGVTPQHYIRDYRVQKAAQALTETSASAADIATSCGFSDVSYFTKVFRTVKGCTPGEYRKRNTSGN